MYAGANVGYSSTKAISDGGRKVLFPSAVVPYLEGHFALDETHDIVIEDEGLWLVGTQAVLKSMEASQYEDRDWILTDSYMRLWYAALTELTLSTRVTMQVVTGLPTRYYKDREVLAGLLRNEHRIRRADRRITQVVTLSNVAVVPEQFGTLFSVCLNEAGVIVPMLLSDGRAIDVQNAHIGIIDPGGGTTGFLHIGPNLTELPEESFTIDEGCWEVVRSLERLLDTEYPGLGLRGHEVVEAIKAGQVTYYGKMKDIRPLIEKAAERLVEAIITAASQRWRIGERVARMSAVLLTGGGALLVGNHPRMKAKFPQMVVVDDPVMANARGFLRFAHRLWDKDK